jgi:hypothetical protein
MDMSGNEDLRWILRHLRSDRVYLLRSGNLGTSALARRSN